MTEAGLEGSPWWLFLPRIPGAFPAPEVSPFPFFYLLHEKGPGEVLRASFSPFYFEGE